MKFFGRIFLAILIGSTASSVVRSADEKTESKNGTSSEAKSHGPSKEDIAGLEKLLTNSVLVGHFTIEGKDGPPKKERYELGTVKKLAGDLWLIQARIKYGDHNVPVPLSLPIRWAGDTPVITVDKVTIPGLGTFNSRVAISDGKYAGTWQHGEVGGHLFGKIEKDGEESGDADDDSDTEESDSP